jgi:hypothetical protein
MRLPAWTALGNTWWWFAAFAVAALIPVPADAQPAAVALPLAPFAGTVVPEPVPSFTEWWRDGGPRLRTTDTRMARLLEQALSRSARVRALAAQLDAGDVIVYLMLDPRLDSGLAGRLTLLGRSPLFRFVRVVLNGSRSIDQMLVSLGHELQHAVEVLEAPEVVDEASLLALYQRIGTETRVSGRPGWETAAAFRVGQEVRRELNLNAALLARRVVPADRE